MSWRDSLLQAEFRGVTFLVESIDSEIGRRTVSHEFPGKDEATQEDLGRRARRFTVEGFVVGPSYMDERNDLMKALEEKGPAKLVHPYWGETSVSLDGPVHVRESDAEGGMARFSMVFVESGKQSLPSVRSSTADDLRAKADVASAAVVSNFKKKFSVADMLQSAVASALAAVDDVLNTINEARALVQGVFDAIDSITKAIDDIKSAVQALMALPQQLANKLVGVYESLFGWIGTDTVTTSSSTGSAGTNAFAGVALRASPEEAPDQVTVLNAALERLEALKAPMATPSVITPTVERELVNEAAVQDLARGLVAVEASRAASLIAFSSYDQAIKLRDRIATAIDAVLPTADDELYAALVLLRSALVEHLNAAAFALPQIVTFTPPVTLPGLVLAHRLYGDATREDEILKRNAVRHPGFVSGGQPLQVVSRG